MARKNKIFQPVLITMLTAMLASCATHYKALGYIEFQGLDVMKVGTLRSECRLFLKKKCRQTESHQDSPKRVKFSNHFTFHDVYDCDDNIYIFVNQMSVTVSYQEGQKIGSRRWKVLGQGIELLAQGVEPNLKMIWPKNGTGR